MLENFGLRIIGESPYQIKTTDGNLFWVLDFQMLHNNVKLDLEASRDLFQDAFAKVWDGHYEDDGFNRLVLSAGLTGRQVIILRMFAKYMRQIGTTFSQSYIESTFGKYPLIAKLIIKLFYTKFEPKEKSRAKKIEALETRIASELENVANLDDDRIIRRYVELILAALRTNFFQADASGNENPTFRLSLCLNLFLKCHCRYLSTKFCVFTSRRRGAFTWWQSSSWWLALVRSP